MTTMTVKKKPAKTKARHLVDYDALYERLKDGPLTYTDIKDLTGLPTTAVSGVINTLTMRYPLYSPSRGVYTLLTKE